MVKFIIFSCFFIIATSFSLSSKNYYDDEEFQNDNVIQKKDTLCFKYKFNAGDTIYYYVVSYDSIVIDYDTPLKKSRYERIRLVCDSVGSKGNFYMSQTLVDFISSESKDDIKNVERTESPWVGRTAHIEIDSLGKRYSTSVDDPAWAVMSPGGAFQPVLLLTLDQQCKAINESWIVESEDALIENGTPPPVFRQSLLMRLAKPYDTLGYRCCKIEFISTGQGSVYLITNTDSINVTSVNNGYGKVSIADSLFIPVHLFATVEQKLTIYTPNGIQKPGWHYIYTDYTLDQYIPSTKATAKQPQLLKKEGKKKR